MANSSIENTNAKTIRIIYYIILASIIILTIGFMITGIVFWSKATFTYKGETHTNETLVGLGFAFFFGGSFISVISGLINYVIFGMIFDIKALRNHFAPNTLSPMPNKKAENKPIYLADEIKNLKELLDMGFITQEEYEERKKKILNM